MPDNLSYILKNIISLYFVKRIILLLIEFGTRDAILSLDQ
jgi:hypothetical protein